MALSVYHHQSRVTLITRHTYHMALSAYHLQSRFMLSTTHTYSMALSMYQLQSHYRFTTTRTYHMAFQCINSNHTTYVLQHILTTCLCQCINSNHTTYLLQHILTTWLCQCINSNDTTIFSSITRCRIITISISICIPKTIGRTVLPFCPCCVVAIDNIYKHKWHFNDNSKYQMQFC